MTLNDQIERKVKELFNVMWPCRDIYALAKHVLAAEIRAELKGIDFSEFWKKEQIDIKEKIILLQAELKELEA